MSLIHIQFIYENSTNNYFILPSLARLIVQWYGYKARKLFRLKVIFIKPTKLRSEGLYRSQSSLAIKRDGESVVTYVQKIRLFWCQVTMAEWLRPCHRQRLAAALRLIGGNTSLGDAGVGSNPTLIRFV